MCVFFAAAVTTSFINKSSVLQPEKCKYNILFPSSWDLLFITFKEKYMSHYCVSTNQSWPFFFCCLLVGKWMVSFLTGKLKESLKNQQRDESCSGSSSVLVGRSSVGGTPVWSGSAECVIIQDSLLWQSTLSCGGVPVALWSARCDQHCLGLPAEH